MRCARCWLTLLIALVLTSSATAWSWWRPGQALEGALLFHPTRATEQWLEPPAWFPVEDVWLRTANGTRIHAWWVPVRNARGAVLFCHGNAGNLSQRGQTVARLAAALGESVLIFDYPGYGKSDGTPSEAGCCAAADAAYAWLTETKHITGADVILFGKSLGGGVATDLATRQPHRALVLVKTFASIPKMAQTSWMTWSSAPLVRNRFDNLEKIGRCPGPVFIAHGDRDGLIPLAQAQQLVAAAPSPKQFFLLKGSGHNDPLPADFLTALAQFLQTNRHD